MDLCVPWLEESSHLFERSMKEFCSLMNEWNKTSATFIERQRFCVLSNFMTKGYWSSHNETAASAWQQQNADWWSDLRKQITTPIIQKILQPIDVEQWIQMMKPLDD